MNSGQPIASAPRIRALVSADLDQAAQVVAVCTDGNAERQRGFLERIHARGEVDNALFVAELESRIVGVARVAFYEPAPDAPTNTVPSGWYLLGVNVEPAHRRRGIGRALTVSRLVWVTQRAQVAWCFTDASNEASIRLHEALGFQHNTRDFWFPTAKFGAQGGILFSLALHG